MTKDPTTRVDRILPGLFVDLADARTPAYLESAIERASSRPQRPAWTHPGRWLPMQITTEALPTARGLWVQLGVLVLIGALIALASVAYVGSQPTRPTIPALPLGLATNGLIALAKDGDIVVADRPGGETRLLVAGPEQDREPKFSPDGKRLAFLRSTDRGAALMVADADGTNVVRVVPDTSDVSTSVDWGSWSFAPDSRSLVAAASFNGEKRLFVHPLDPPGATRFLDVRLPGGWMYNEPPRFRPTNPEEILVLAQPVPDGPRVLSVYELATGGIRTIAGEPDLAYLRDVAWLPDGEHIVYSLGPIATHVVAADGSGDRVVDALRDRVSPFSNDGTRIVVERGGLGEAAPQLAVVRVDGEGEPVVLACGDGSDGCPTWWIWSPDDSTLIGTRYEGEEYPLKETYWQVDPDTGQVTALDWVDVGIPAWQRVAP